MFKNWFNLLCLSADRGGVIPSLGDAALAMHMTRSKASKVIAFLSEKGLLDQVDGGFYRPHNWEARQFQSDTSNERVRRHRERET